MHVIRYVLIFAAYSLVFDDSQKNGFSQEKTTSLPASWRLGGISTQKYFAFLFRNSLPLFVLTLSIFSPLFFLFVLLQIYFSACLMETEGAFNTIFQQVFHFSFLSLHPLTLSHFQSLLCVFLVTNRLLIGPDNVKYLSKGGKNCTLNEEEIIL